MKLQKSQLSDLPEIVDCLVDAFSDVFSRKQGF